VELADLNFAKGAPVQRLELAGGRVYMGNTAKQPADQQPFQCLAGDPAAKKK